MSVTLPAPWVTDFEGIQQNFDALTQLLADLAPGGHAQVADVKMTARATAPTGWILCDGAAVSRSLYARLFAAIGTTYGVGDGSTTFNVPNFLGAGPIAPGSSGTGGATSHTLGQRGGEETHLTLAGESGLPDHAHDFSGHAVMTQAIAASVNGGPNGANTANITQTGPVIGGAQNAASRHNNMQPYTVVNFVIKV